MEFKSFAITASLFFLQMIYAFTATRRVSSAIGSSTVNYVGYGLLNDLVKYGISAALAVQAVAGDYVVIITTIAGGAIGNAIGHKTRAKTWK